MDQRFASFGHEMGERFDALGRMLAARDVQFARLAAMDVSLEHLETKTATEFRYLRWGLGIVIALVLGLVTKVILDWLMRAPAMG
jgi:steroid 5-alpha reductase family enzyme